MGKNPAFQFYPNDWLGDNNLQMASTVSRGVWIQMLCRMWWSDPRGQLTGSRDQLCQLAVCTEEELEQFLSDNNSLHFASVTERDKIITIVNRRMEREEKARKSNVCRQAKYRNAHSNAPVTVPSPSTPSPSTPSTEKSTDGFLGISRIGPERSDNHGKGKPTDLRSVLTDAQSLRAKLLCRSIEALPRKVRPFLPWVFLQKSVTQGLPADDALKVLVGMRDRWAEIRDPWAYAAEVLRREYQQFRIDLQLEAHEKRKRDPARVGAILAAAVARAQGEDACPPPPPPTVEPPPETQEFVEGNGGWVPADEAGPVPAPEPEKPW